MIKSDLKSNSVEVRQTRGVDFWPWREMADNRLAAIGAAPPRRHGIEMVDSAISCGVPHGK
jgi:hypothetical protein